MYRLKLATLILGLLLLAIGCGAGRSIPAPEAHDSVARNNPSEFPGWAWTEETEYATLAAMTPVPEAMARLMRPQAEPSVRELPALPSLGTSGRTPSATVQYERLGSQVAGYSANTTLNGSSIELNAAAGEISWAIYEFADLGVTNELQLIHVEASADNFSGEYPGYWVGWADYARDTWEIKGRTQHVNYLRVIGDTAPYLDAGNSFYCFVLIADGQSVTVDRVALDVDQGDWTEIVVDDRENTGWTPAIVFSNAGNPGIAYADYDTGKPRWIIGDRSSDLTIESNWQKSAIEITPNGTAKWLDAVIDPGYDLPRVSMVFEGASDLTWNSTIGFGFIAEPSPGSLFWAAYVVGDIDGAEYTSLDRRPVSGYFGITSMARNENRTDQAANDMHFRQFELEDPNSGDPIPVTLKRGFQPIFPELPDPFAFKYPHLRMNPSLGNAAVCVNGGYMIYENSIDDWANPYSQENSGELGSLAINPVTGFFGQTFNFTDGSNSRLIAVEYSFSVPGSPVVVDSLSQSAGTERVGEASQIAYTADGNPGIAYTVFDGAATRIMYACLDGSDWIVEAASTDYMDNVGDAQIIVDLAYDGMGTAGICYNYVDGNNCELRACFRGL